jgi:rod shape determining protein RodA
MFDLSTLRNINWVILSAALLIVALGAFFIYSGSYRLSYDTGVNYVEKQLLWSVFGILTACFFAAFDYRKFSYMAFVIYGLTVLMLILVLLAADPRRGARSWLSVGGFSVQPSEFAKIAIILALAKYLSGDYVRRNSFAYILWAVIIAGIPMLLILKQPDLGTAIVLLPVLAVMLVAAGARVTILFYLTAAGLMSAPLTWFFLKPYQQLRIKAFLNPQLDPLRSGYNAIQSQIAVGSGGLLGQGWLHGMQTHLRFLPERHTDFIFSVLGEETGFLGCLLLFVLYMIIIISGFNIAEQAKDSFGKLVAVGVTVLIAAHAIINIGMTIGLLPITGIPLPLMSYGGSSMLTMFICLGLVESVYARRYVF